MSGTRAAVPIYVGLSVLALARAAAAHRAERARGRLAGDAARRSGRGRPSVARAVALVRRIRHARDVDGGGALADAVEALVDALAVSVPVVDALAGIARAAPPQLRAALAAVVDELRAGVPVALALERWAAAPGAPDGAALVAAAFGLAAETGADPVGALGGVAATLRDRQAAAREVQALATQARLSATVIVLAPIGFSVVTAGLGGQAAAFLLGSPLGLVCLVAGVGLDLLGWRWMRRITDSVR